jgi:hypothetical protein
MIEIIIIICLLLVLLITVQYRRNRRNKKTKKNKINHFEEDLSDKLNDNNINVIGKNKGQEMRTTKYNYYTKKRVRFSDERPASSGEAAFAYARELTYYDCPKEENLSEQDRFIDEYVFNNRVFCKNKATPIDSPLAEYRRDIFDFRDKTNQIANNYSPVDRIDEMIVNSPDLSGMKIADIYNGLTSNEFNTNYTSINMPTGDNNISYINDNNGNSSFSSYKSEIY